ncbi:type IV secretory system conjugative DNA transfer family protein [Halocatena salina]|uniref:Type IV secretion system DNA-binding domain-containing protein n=1 Tax=Halocatena salina TaxID=2934340 RepID=A0A8U0A3F6_9EURY|nr:type IV secretion system DNA-binding domain-containing protein [Halocatena salina]UPM43725.1 type IV secretion system DNA-binding domain-containing protein [Halocatena salina]
MEIASAVSLWILAGLVVLAVGPLFVERPMWSPFWRGVSSIFDPLRAVHWTIVPFLVLLGLGLFGIWVRSIQLIPVTVLWGVLAGLSLMWFCRGRYHAYRYWKGLGDGLVINMDIENTSEGIGLLDQWAGSVDLPKRSILVAGAPGSGKTEAAKHLVQQLLFDQDSLVLVYDHKSDFQEFFDSINVDYIKISMEGSTHIWNLFREFDSNHDVDEFARALFPQLSGGDNDFFDDMARQVFAACLKMMLHRSDKENLSNAAVRYYFQTRGVQEVYEDLNEYSEFQAAASAIDVEASPKQAQGVYASVQRVVNKVFVGDFGDEPDDGRGFSLREHTNDPQGVPIVLDFPKESGQATKPIFRFLIDHAAMFAMQDTDEYSYFVLDEFAQIPHLRRLEELVNVGRGEQVVTLVTLQSVQQLYENYGESGGEAILAGLVSMILLRPNDPQTVEFYRSAIGEDFSEYTQHVGKDSWDRKRREVKEVEEHPFSTGEIRRWDPGVGVVVKQAGWLHGYISMLNDTTREFVESVLKPADPASGSDATALPEKSSRKALEPGESTEEQRSPVPTDHD